MKVYTVILKRPFTSQRMAENFRDYLVDKIADSNEVSILEENCCSCAERNKIIKKISLFIGWIGWGICMIIIFMKD